MKPKDRIIVALDTNYLSAVDIIEKTRGHVGMYKVGYRLILDMLVAGRPLAELAHIAGTQFMLDMKLHDIPNTMAGALASIVVDGDIIWGVTAHVTAGVRGLVHAVKLAKPNRIKTIAVTVLTSHSDDEVVRIYNNKVGGVMLRFVRDAEEAGCDAIVCSPHEAGMVRRNLDQPDKMTIVCPGVRPNWAQKGDQRRVLTPKQAVEAGADYLVIGRPIIQAPDGMRPAEAAQRIAEEL